MTTEGFATLHRLMDGSQSFMPNRIFVGTSPTDLSQGPGACHERQIFRQPCQLKTADMCQCGGINEAQPFTHAC